MHIILTEKFERVRRGDIVNTILSEVAKMAEVAAQERTSRDAVAVALKAGVQAGLNLRPIFDALPGGLESPDNQITLMDIIHDMANAFCDDFSTTLMLAEDLTEGGN